MKRQTILITLIFGVSIFVQVVSNIILTRLFGTSLDYSHFLTAVTLPTIIITVIYGSLNDSLMPLYGEKLAKDKIKANNFFSEQITTLILLGVMVSAVLIVFSEPLIKLFFSSRYFQISTLSSMFSFMTLAIPFCIFATALGMRQYAEKRFFKFPLAQLVGSVVNLILVLIFFQRFGAWGLVYSFVLSVAIQILFISPPKLKFHLGNVLPTLSLWVPLIIGVTALKSDTLIIRSFSAQMGTDFIVYQNLISKVCILSAGLITIGLQIVLLPYVIESLAKKDFERTKELVNKAKLSAITLSIILVTALYFFAPFVIKLLFVGGKFTAEDYQKTIQLLPYYLLPVFGWGIVNIFIQPLYALKKHLQVGILSLVCLVISWFTSSAISPTSVPLAISVGLSILLIGSSVGAEFLWQYHFRRISK